MITGRLFSSAQLIVALITGVIGYILGYTSQQRARDSQAHAEQAEQLLRPRQQRPDDIKERLAAVEEAIWPQPSKIPLVPPDPTIRRTELSKKMLEGRVVHRDVVKDVYADRRHAPQSRVGMFPGSF